jgi:hypothetical protein
LRGAKPTGWKRAVHFSTSLTAYPTSRPARRGGVSGRQATAVLTITQAAFRFERGVYL